MYQDDGQSVHDVSFMLFLCVCQRFLVISIVKVRRYFERTTKTFDHATFQQKLLVCFKNAVRSDPLLVLVITKSYEQERVVVFAAL